MSGSTDTSDLRLLLVRTGEGDEVAFADLYQLTSAKLFGVALRICVDRELAREALQDSYVRVWKNAKDYNPDIASPIAWMATIARNRSIDLRRSQAERVSSQSAPLDEMPMDGTGPGIGNMVADTELSDDMHALMRCLGRLPEDQREMLLLAYYTGWSRDELAQKFARPVATIKTVLRRSLELIRGCLDER